MASKKDDKKKGGLGNNISWSPKKSGNPGTVWKDSNTGFGGRTSVGRDDKGKPSVYGHFTESDRNGKETKATGAIQAGEVKKFPSWAKDAVNLADKLSSEKQSSK